MTLIPQSPKNECHDLQPKDKKASNIIYYMISSIGLAALTSHDQVIPGLVPHREPEAGPSPEVVQGDPDADGEVL